MIIKRWNWGTLVSCPIVWDDDLICNQHIFQGGSSTEHLRRGILKTPSIFDTTWPAHVVLQAQPHRCTAVGAVGTCEAESSQVEDGS